MEILVNKITLSSRVKLNIAPFAITLFVFYIAPLDNSTDSHIHRNT